MSYNIEKNIKKEFKNREIQPSTNTWNKLSEKLEIAEKERENNTYKWLFYAAILSGIFIGIYTLINRTDSNNKIMPIVIEEIPAASKIIQENKKPDLEKTKEIKQADEEKITTIKEKQHKNTHIAISNKSKNSKQQKSKHQIIKNTSPKTILMASTNTANTQSDKNSLKSLNKTTILDKKKMLSNDKDIDNLLIKALNKIPQNNVKQVIVQSNILENSTGSKLKKPLKNKIIETLKTGVDTVEALLVSNN